MHRITTITLSLSLCASAPALAQTPAAGRDTARVVVSRAGTRPVAQAPATNFTGVARVEMLFGATDTTRASGGMVTFEPGARTAWHTHPRGQRLIVTAGTGRVQRWGGPVDEIREGDVVWIPPGVKHWHGAAPATSMTHLAISEHLNGRSVDWLEQVTDGQYGAASGATQAVARPAGATAHGAQPSAGRAR